MKIKLIEKYFTTTFIFLILIFGFYLCFIGGYGSDEDTLPMLYVFETRLTDGRFVTSRFTSYPIPEIGIGFLLYFFGSFVANSFTFLFNIIGLFLIYFSFNKNLNFNKLNLFLILCLSNPILFFENLEPMDYSWAFLFFSLGTFFFSRKIFELSIIAFGFAIGCRLNFLIFILFFIYFYDLKETINYKKRSLIFINIFVIGGLFYLPIWFDNGFGLSWITAARPTEQGIFGLIARFTHKSVMTFGLIQLLLIFFYLFKTKNNTKSDLKTLILLTISNLAIFLYIPAEKSYLQPAIIFFNLILIEKLKKNIIILLIILNFISWIVSYDFLRINYKDNSLCAPKHAVSASLELSFSYGALKNFYDTRKMIACWVNPNTDRGKKIMQGKPTRKK